MEGVADDRAASSGKRSHRPFRAGLSLTPSLQLPAARMKASSEVAIPLKAHSSKSISRIVKGLSTPNIGEGLHPLRRDGELALPLLLLLLQGGEHAASMPCGLLLSSHGYAPLTWSIQLLCRSTSASYITAWSWLTIYLLIIMWHAPQRCANVAGGGHIGSNSRPEDVGETVVR